MEREVTIDGKDGGGGGGSLGDGSSSAPLDTDAAGSLPSREIEWAGGSMGAGAVEDAGPAGARTGALGRRREADVARARASLRATRPTTSVRSVEIVLGWRMDMPATETQRV